MNHRTAHARQQLAAYGDEHMGAEELVALIVGGTSRHPAQTVARALIAHTGGLAQLARASTHELVGVPGVGPAAAARLAAAFCLARRTARATAAAGGIASAADVHARLAPRLAGLAQEVFVALALDVRNAVLAEIEIARGCLTGVEVHPREVFRPLIRIGAAAAVVAHNHPSGDPAPSDADIALTERLRQVGELVGIPLFDHVVIAQHRYVSVADLPH